MNRTEDMGNNETRSYGIFYQGAQGWLAMSRTQSKWFKTERGATNWLKRNYPQLAEKLVAFKAIENNKKSLEEMIKAKDVLEKGEKWGHLTLDNCLLNIWALKECIANIEKDL
jgi:hypothetical protein